MAVKETALKTQEQQQSPSIRFTEKVMAEFGASAGSSVQLTIFQKRLAQNYFISIDSVLREAEAKRLAKSEKYRDSVPMTWPNVDMEALSRSVVAAARIGLDPALPAQIYPIPYKNKHTGKYTVNLMLGYRGKELQAVKYGVENPNMTIEVVHANDTFKQIKRDKNNPIETYEFEIKDAFNRGDIIGGFYYKEYPQDPSKNKLTVMSMPDIEKRKSAGSGNPEFWGGEKDEWKDGKKVGKVEVPGWKEEMVYKTICRAAYGSITIDSQKIDDDYMQLSQSEMQFEKSMAETPELEKAGEANQVIVPATYVAEDEVVEEPEVVDQNADLAGTPFPTSTDEADF